MIDLFIAWWALETSEHLERDTIHKHAHNQVGLTIKHHCKGYLWIQNMYHKKESQAGKSILAWCQASFLDVNWDTTMRRYESLFILQYHKQAKANTMCLAKWRRPLGGWKQSPYPIPILETVSWAFTNKFCGDTTPKWNQTTGLISEEKLIDT